MALGAVRRSVCVEGYTDCFIRVSKTDLRKWSTSHTYKPYGAYQQGTWLPWSWAFETAIPLAGWTPIQSSVGEALTWLGYPIWNDRVDTDWRRFLVLVIWYQCLCDIEGA
jgi:hypothetical protein